MACTRVGGLVAVSGGGGGGRRGVGMLVGEVLRGRLAIMGKLDFFFFFYGEIVEVAVGV
jgi:hypothetical protein